jgi:hypothetical protein
MLLAARRFGFDGNCCCSSSTAVIFLVLLVLHALAVPKPDQCGLLQVIALCSCAFLEIVEAVE